jgi:uroporphyrinogen-III synthase
VTADALGGLRVLVTRPARQAAALCEMIRQAGGEALALPLLAIAPVEDAAAAAAQLAAAAPASRCIFTSANAVHCGLRLHPGPWPQRLAAAGAATAAALRAAGFAQVLLPAHGDGADGLLAEPALQDLAGERVLIVTGADSLPALAQGLSARGAEVRSVAVYRRVPEAVDAARVAALLAAAQAAIVTSGEALDRLYAVTPLAQREQLLQLQLVVASPRLAERAGRLGFRSPPLIPKRVADAGFVAVLRHWRAQR